MQLEPILHIDENKKYKIKAFKNCTIHTSEAIRDQLQRLYHLILEMTI